MIDSTRLRAAAVAVVFMLAACWPQAVSAQLRTSIVASGFSSPIEFVQDPLDPAVQYILEQSGTIRIIRRGVLTPTIFLDMTRQINLNSEQGLLGMAFAPDYATSARLFLYFNGTDGNIRVARFKRGTNGLVDPASRFDFTWSTGLRFIDHSFAGNHNGGHIQFGPDGFLYLGIGDGGGGDDPNNNAQNMTVLLGKMLRIDVNVPDSNARGYQIPPSNPFTGGARPEIWDVGMRNPWRFSFDDPARGGNGALIIGDVGQGAWEEVDYEPAGAGGRNYGWSIREGAQPNPNPNNANNSIAFMPLVDPVIQYRHPEGFCIIGGYVYHGTALPPFYRGRYFFADYVNARLWSVATDPVTHALLPDTQIEHTAEIGGSGRLGNVTTFGVDAAGEMYILSQVTGRLLKLVSTGTPARATANDYDGDGVADLTILRNNSSADTWFLTQSSTANQNFYQVTFGQSSLGDVAAPADYDGDGRTDPALFRSSTGDWLAMTSASGFTQQSLVGHLGQPHDVPIPRDYDGDGRADVAIYRPSTGLWSIVKSSTGAPLQMTFGGGDDQPVPADFDGDGKADLALYRPSTGFWYVLTSSSGYTFQAIARQWGKPGVIPVPADYDGDGLADLAYWDPATGTWSILTSSSGYQTSVAVVFGSGSDIPVPGDYDGDGKTDIAIFRPSTGEWFILFGTAPNVFQLRYLWGGSAIDSPLSAPQMLSNNAVACGYNLSATTLTVPRAGGSQLTTIGGITAGCLWTAVSFAPWISVNPANGSGGGGVTMTAAPNPGTVPRTGVMVIAGQIVTVTEGGTPPGSDFNGDGKPDIVWHNYATGENRVWLQNGTTTTGTVVLPTVTDLHWKLVGVADVNGDGHPDLLTHNILTGENLVSFTNGTTVIGTASLPAIDTRWQPVALDDFDGDGHPDLLWRQMTTGQMAIWFLNGTTMTGAVALPGVSLQWEVAATGDLDGDRRADIVWHNRATGDNVFWTITGGTIGLTGALPSNPDPAWHVVDLIDINGDGHPDLIWRNTTTGRTVATYLVGAQSIGGGDFALETDLNWSIRHQANVQRPADFDGNARADFLWRNATDGTNMIWFMNGMNRMGTAVVPTQADLNWHLIDAADINGDGWLDLIWYKVTTGEVQVWYGPTFTTTAALQTEPDVTWRLVAAGDLNGDGIPELIWRNTVSGANRAWFLNGTALLQSVDLMAVTDPTWSLVAVGDLDGDNQADLLWRKTSGPNAGATSVWLMSGTTPVSFVALDPVVDSNWQLAGAVDVNGDGFADLVWQNSGSGANSGIVAIWYMNGSRVLGYDSIAGAAPSLWRLAR